MKPPLFFFFFFFNSLPAHSLPQQGKTKQKRSDKKKMEANKRIQTREKWKTRENTSCWVFGRYLFFLSDSPFVWKFLFLVFSASLAERSRSGILYMDRIHAAKKTKKTPLLLFCLESVPRINSTLYVISPPSPGTTRPPSKTQTFWIFYNDDATDRENNNKKNIHG